MDIEYIIETTKRYFEYVSSFFALITLVISTLGIGGIVWVSRKIVSKIAEQRPEIIFGYYAKMKIYLLSIKKSLGNVHNTPLHTFLTTNATASNSGDSESPDVDDDVSVSDNNDPESYKADEALISLLKSEAVDFLLFLKKEDWQIPIDFEFEKNFQLFIEKLYLLSKLQDITPYANIDDIIKEDEGEFYKCTQLVNSLINSIATEQNRLVKKYEKSQQSVLRKIKNIFKKNIFNKKKKKS